MNLVYSTSNGTAAVHARGGAAGCTPGINACDYVTIPAGTAIVIPAGETVVNVPVSVVGDTMFEGNQTFTFTVGLAAGETDATIGDGAAIGTIVDDDAVPTLAINDPAAVQEPNVAVDATTTTPVTFTITLTGAHERQATVVWSTTDGTATGGVNLGILTLATTDYFIAGGTATFAGTVGASQTASVSVGIRRNSANDPAGTGTETFFVNLGRSVFGATVAPTNATIADNQGLGTIINRQ